MRGQTQVYFGGVPTEPDVQKLVDKFGVPAPGVIAHADLEKVLGLTVKESRYRTVVGAWRGRLLREHNVASVAAIGEGIRILTEPERVEYGRRTFGLTARKVVRNHRWAMMIDASKLSETEKVRCAHLVRATAAGAAAMVTTHKDLSIALKVPEQLPNRHETKTGA